MSPVPNDTNLTEESIPSSQIADELKDLTTEPNNIKIKEFFKQTDQNLLQQAIKQNSQILHNLALCDDKENFYTAVKICAPDFMPITDAKTAKFACYFDQDELMQNFLKKINAQTEMSEEIWMHATALHPISLTLPPSRIDVILTINFRRNYAKRNTVVK